MGTAEIHALEPFQEKDPNEVDIAERLTQVIGVIGEGADLRSVLRQVAKAVCEIVDVERCSIYLRDGKTGQYKGQAGFGDTHFETVLPKQTTAVGIDRIGQEVVASRRPVILTNARQDPRAIRATMHFWKIRSMLGVPMVVGDDVVGIMYLDTAEKQETFTGRAVERATIAANLAGFIVAQTMAVSAGRRRLDKLSEKARFADQLASAEDRLAELFIEGGSLTELTATVAELTGRPCGVIGRDGTLLGSAILSTEVEPGEVPPLPGMEGWDGAEVLGAMADLGSEGGALGAVGPALANHRLIVAPVKLDGNVEAYFVMNMTGAANVDAHLQIARRGARAIASYMAVQRRVRDLERDASGAILLDLVQAGPMSDVNERRAARYGWDAKRSTVLCLVASTAPEQEVAPTSSTLARVLEDRMGVPVRSASVEQGALLAVECPDGSASIDFIQSLREALLAVFDTLGSVSEQLAAGVSAPITDLADFPRAYSEARRIFSCVDSLETDGVRVLVSADLGAGRLLFGGADRHEAHRYARYVLGDLLTDAPGMDELRATLQAYLDCGGSVRKAGPALDVHANTVRYRLNRIEEMIGLDVSQSGRARLEAQVALLAYDFGQGRLPGAEIRLEGELDPDD